MIKAVSKRYACSYLVASGSSRMLCGNRYLPSSFARSHILHLIDFIRWLFVRMCSNPLSLSSKSNDRDSLLQRLHSLDSCVSAQTHCFKVAALQSFYSYVWICSIPGSELSGAFASEAAFGIPSGTWETACACSEDGGLAGR
jgi:hypothetical protein